MPKLPTDYSKTIIYKLVKNDDLENENIYVGSTTDFTSRKYRHKSCCNNENDKRHNLKVYKSIRSNGGWSEWNMIEIEKYPCNDKREAEARERYWFEFYNAKLNSVMMFVAPEEKNKYIKEYTKQYYLENADKIKQNTKQYRIENADKVKQYYIDNYDKKKQYYIENANKFKQKITCECGKVIANANKLIHAKSKRHINYMNSLEN